MSNLIDVRELKPGQRFYLRRDTIVTVTARTSVVGDWATMHTNAGSIAVKLPNSAQLA